MRLQAAQNCGGRAADGVNSGALQFNMSDFKAETIHRYLENRIKVCWSVHFRSTAEVETGASLLGRLALHEYRDKLREIGVDDGFTLNIDQRIEVISR